MGKVRDKRLLADQQKILDLARHFPFMSILQTKGMPATEYLIEFRLRGYVTIQGHVSNRHLLKLNIPEKYPFSAPPKFSFLNGLFHPNVYSNGDVCHGWYLNNWNPAIRLDDLLLDIIKMVAFTPDSYNLASPANYACNRDWIATHRIPIDTTPININFYKGNVVPKTPTPPPANRIVNRGLPGQSIKSQNPSSHLNQNKRIAAPMLNKENKPLKIRIKNDRIKK